MGNNINIKKIFSSILVFFICFSLVNTTTILATEEEIPDDIIYEEDNDETSNEITVEEDIQIIDIDEEDTVFQDTVEASNEDTSLPIDQETDRQRNTEIENTVPTPTFTAPTTARIGDTVTTTFDGFSFVNYDTGIRDLQFTQSIYGTVNSSAEFQRIIIPAIYGVTTTGREFDIRVMAFYPTENNSISYRQIKVIQFDDSNPYETFEITKDDILAPGNGQLPYNVTVHFSDSGYGGHLNELTQTAPIKFEYTVVDNKSLFNDTDTYQSYYGEASWYTTDLQNRDTHTFWRFPRFITSELTITADQDTELLPGDEIELTFNMRNFSAYNNTTLWAGMEAAGIIAIEGSANVISEDYWYKVGDNNFSIAMFGESSWLTIPAGEEVTFSKRFKIADDFEGNQIELKPYVYHNAEQSNRSYYDSTFLYIGVNEVIPTTFSVQYDVNGGLGDAPVDVNEYFENSEVTILGADELYKKGYTFVNWNTEMDGSGDNYIPGDILTIHQDIILYAQWIQVEELGKEDPKVPVPETPTLPGVTPTTQTVANNTDVVNTADTTSLIGLFMIASGISFIALHIWKTNKMKEEQ